MDISNIDSQLQLLNSIGFTITTQQKLKLSLSQISLLEAFPDLDQIRFWGKINTIGKPYYIIQGVKYSGCFQFPHKNYFYASNDFNFKNLPQLLEQHKGLSNNINILFTGDPNKVIVQIEGQAGESQQPPKQNQEQLDSEEEEERKKNFVPKQNFTELHRLAQVVRAIDNDAFCVPKGSQRVTVQHQLHPNGNFQGLNRNNACDLDSWYHFRAPQTEQAKKIIENSSVIFQTNFLDSISSETLKGCWSLQLDSQQTGVTLRNLLWPGSYGFHRLNSGLYGNVYIGDGVKNTDLPFMII